MRWRSCVGVLAALLGGCAPPALRAAHSLPRGKVEAGIDLYGKAGTATGTILSPTGEASVASTSFHMNPTAELPMMHARFGLGAGFEVGLRGLFLPSEIDLKWSLLDERRHRTPLSVAVDAAVAFGVGGEAAPQGGVLLSTTRGGSRFQVRPIANIWYGRGGYAYRLQMSEAALDETEWVDGGDALRVVTRGWGFTVPVGVEAPMRVGQSWSVVPLVAWAPWIPVTSTVVGAECDGCNAGLSDFEPGFASYIWFGLRFQPFLAPMRRG